ncbi:MAG: DUF2062 domain-containing protein [Verrucomicrobium sp.]
MAWFALHFLDKKVWKPTRHTFAGGLAIGLFVNMLIIPGQMPLAAILAALFRVNIPIAIVACWISNPVTMPPIAWWEIEFGNWLCHTLGVSSPPPLDWKDLKALMANATGFGNFFAQLKPWAASLYIGGSVAGVVLGLSGYALAFALWDMLLTLTHRRVKEDEDEEDDPTAKPPRP